MARPLVSVIIPAFNAEATLAETVRSALASSYEPIEVIIVDDGSTDGTGAIARDLADVDPRVRVVSRENGGLSAALNSGFAQARGDYVARLDADDLWHPRKLERQMDAAEASPEAAFLYTFVRFVDAEGRVLHDGPRQQFPPRALCRGIVETIVGGGSSALMKRSAVIEAGGCDESFRSLEDLLLQLKISARHPVAFVPEYLVGYRVRPGSLTRDHATMLATWSRLRRVLQTLFPSVPRFVHDWSHARRCAQMAESFAWAGQYRASASLLLAAVRADPQFALRFIGYRIGRHFRRRLGSRQGSAAGPHFLEFDPGEESGLHPFGADSESSSLRRLRERREEQLGILDRELAVGPAQASAGRLGTGK